MNQRLHSTVWPLFCVAVCLVAVAVFSPWNDRDPDIRSSETKAVADDPSDPPVVVRPQTAADVEPAESPASLIGPASKAPPELPPLPRLDIEATRPQRPRTPLSHSARRSDHRPGRRPVTIDPVPADVLVELPNLDVSRVETAEVRPRDVETKKPIARVVAAFDDVPVLDPPRAKPSSAEPPHQVWPRAAALIDVLGELKRQPEFADWAEGVLRRLALLADPTEMGGADSDRILRDLQVDWRDLDRTLARRKPVRRHRVARQAKYALRRRLDLWQAAHHAALAVEDGNPVPAVDPQRMLPVLDAAERQLAADEVLPAWQRYLLLSGLRRAATDRGDHMKKHRRELAQLILKRLRSPKLNEKQRAFLDRPDFTRFEAEVIRWAIEPMPVVRLLATVEDFEQRQGDVAAVILAYQGHRLLADSQPELVELGRAIAKHYLGANVRLAVTDTMINRLAPGSRVENDDVSDYIAGARVLGRQQTRARVGVRLHPDAERLKLGIRVRGRIDSDTVARSSIARFYNDGSSEFEAEKIVELDPNNLSVRPARVRVDAGSTLRGVETDLDFIPIVGLLIRDYAVREHYSRLPRANREIEQRISQQVEEKLDREVQTQLKKLRRTFRRRVAEPLEELKIDAQATATETTDERLIAHYRLSTRGQLAGYSARPWAPAASLISAQVHQSAVNNLLARLELEGKQFTLSQLFRTVSQRLALGEVTPPEDLPPDAELRFAKREALRVRFTAGRAEVTLRLASLKQGRRRWRNLVVRAFYDPVIDGRRARLDRTRSIELSGRRLSFGDQLVLRGVFSKLFSRNRPLPLVPKRLAEHPQLADQHVTQLIVDAGWLAIAIGPHPAPTAEVTITDRTADGSVEVTSDRN